MSKLKPDQTPKKKAAAKNRKVEFPICSICNRPITETDLCGYSRENGFVHEHCSLILERNRKEKFLSKRLSNKAVKLLLKHPAFHNREEIVRALADCGEIEPGYDEWILVAYYPEEGKTSLFASDSFDGIVDEIRFFMSATLSSPFRDNQDEILTVLHKLKPVDFKVKATITLDGKEVSVFE